MPRKRAARTVREMAMDRYGFLSDLQPRRQFPSPRSPPSGEEGGGGCPPPSRSRGASLLHAPAVDPVLELVEVPQRAAVLLVVRAVPALPVDYPPRQPRPRRPPHPSGAGPRSSPRLHVEGPFDLGHLLLSKVVLRRSLVGKVVGVFMGPLSGAGRGPRRSQRARHAATTPCTQGSPAAPAPRPHGVPSLEGRRGEDRPEWVSGG